MKIGFYFYGKTAYAFLLADGDGKNNYTVFLASMCVAALASLITAGTLGSNELGKFDRNKGINLMMLNGNAAEVFTHPTCLLMDFFIVG